jgi:hypothetical protein
MVIPQKLHDKAAYRGSGCVGTGSPAPLRACAFVSYWPVTAMASASQSGSAVWGRPAVAETTGILFDNAGH